MIASLVTHTPKIEYWLAFMARVSSPKNQERMEKGELDGTGLIRYCADHGHWSIFQMANVVMKIKTTRAISAQIIRHRSFSFQEFSQRYSAMDQDIPIPEMRIKCDKNRQSSTEVIQADGLDSNDYLLELIHEQCGTASWTYNELIEHGVAPETARMILPLCTPTKLYMNGTVRSWIHYLEVRCKEDTQKEHREVALACRKILADLLPTCAEVFNWKE